MAGNKTKIDRIHDQMPKYFRTRQNPNWRALIEALGQSDQKLTDLIEEVRKQFFVKTASRPYIDRLGANVKVSRPRFVGMDDPTFRRFIPVLAYQPKQVKLVLDLLLDIFFFKESTTAFTQSTTFEPFALKDGWELLYKVDGVNNEQIYFKSDDFVDINNITAEELVSAINKQAQFSFAIAFDDRIQKRTFVRIYSNTIGSKGSIQILGGRANINLKFAGFNDIAGSGFDTQWQITKVGDTVTFTHIAGTSPNLDKVEMGDIVIIDIPGNEGSFVVTKVDIGTSSFQFTNLFATPGTFDHLSDPESAVVFIKPEKMVVYKNNNRALVWEVSPGEIIVEMPASPPVVKRVLAGSAHINGVVDNVLSRISDTELELVDASEWPMSGGQFILQPQNEIKTHVQTITEDVVLSKLLNTRFDKQNIYTYTGKSGNTLTGISPNLPAAADVYEVAISTAVRDGSYEVTVNTAVPHGFNVGEYVGIQGVDSALSTVGIRVDIMAADSAIDIATKTAARINTLTAFSAFSIGNIVTVTNSANGATTDAADVDAGVTVLVIQQGSVSDPEITEITIPGGAGAYDVVDSSLRWEISSANDETRYHVWYNVVDGANTQFNEGMDSTINGAHKILSVPTPTSFTFTSAGEAGNAAGGQARVERLGMSEAGSVAYLTSAQLDTGILGPYIWDPNAAYVLSSLTTNIQQEIRAGNNVRTLQIDPVNNIPNAEGFVIFGFGTENEEGPVRYLYKPTSSSIQLDPAYVFKNNHEPGDAVTIIRRKGAHVISSIGKEIAPYITDPGVAREVLQELLRQTKSVGIFIEFLIRYPQQLYAALDVYKSGNPDLYPVDQ